MLKKKNLYKLSEQNCNRNVTLMQHFKYLSFTYNTMKFTFDNKIKEGTAGVIFNFNYNLISILNGLSQHHYIC